MRAASAFSLVEVALTLGIAAFCLVSIVGLIQTALISEQSTLGRTAANDVLSAIFADLAATPADDDTSDTFGFALETSSIKTPQTLFFSDAATPTGPAGGAATARSRYRASVGIRPASDPESPALVRIVVSWPAAADPAPGQWPANAAGSVEVVTTLDRYR